jgi:hypothetical protein
LRLAWGLVVTGRQVSVEIDELVLVGFERGDRETIAAGLRDELAVLLAQARPRAAVRTRASLEYELGGDRGPEAVGRAAARSIADHLGGGGR